MKKTFVAPQLHVESKLAELTLLAINLSTQ